MYLLLLLVAWSCNAHIHHDCIHDKITKEHERYFVHHKVDEHKRSTANFTWGNIRITADWSQFTPTDAFGIFIRQTVIPAAFAKLNKIFRVQQEAGNLLLHKQCARYYENPYRCVAYYPANCGSDIAIPSQYLAEDGGPGLPDTDYVVWVTGKPTTGNTLAYASPCQFAAVGRPVAGYINFGPRDGDYKDPLVIESWTFTAMHELFHALGFSSYVWNNFYKTPTGQPYVPYRNFTERGEVINKIVSPSALREGAKYLGCPGLNGVEIENGGGSGTAGSHLEERVFNDAMMTGSLGQTSWIALSPVELGVMEDSGWYQIDYTQAGVNYWGRNQGCIFAYDKCLNGTLANPYPIAPKYYCTSTKIGCTMGRYSRGVCQTYSFTQALPAPYRYFASATTGGPDELVDFCPFWVPYSNGNCRAIANQPVENYWGETYGAAGRCLPSTLEDQSFSRYYVNQGSACYAVACTDQGFSVIVKGQQQFCSREGQVLTWPGFRGNITCPAVAEVC